MFFIISKILSFLTDPFFWIFTLFLFGLFNRKKYKRRKYIMAGFISLFIFSNSFIYKFVFSYWEVEYQPIKEQYDYGILLGGMISLNSTPNNIEFNSSSERLLKTIDLYHKKRIKKIIITGASGSLISDLKEADCIKTYLINSGIPSKDILTETQSRNTYENAVFTTKLIRKITKNNIPECLLITSDYHMRRSLMCFNNTGLAVDPYLIDLDKKYFDFESIILPQSHILFEWKKLTHEIAGYITYKLVGYI
jgi:uncharacterized SAM-binding protein YcdF (DUF218 family)